MMATTQASASARSELPPGEAEQGPKDGLMGVGFTEEILTRLLA
jgi:hypothetical protein